MKSFLTSLLPSLRPRLALTVGLLAFSGFCLPRAQAQVIITNYAQTNSVPQFVDGGAINVFFDFAAEPLPAPGSLIFKTTISVTFGKLADLSDDPPYFSEIGMMLRKYTPDRRGWTGIYLIATNDFADGAPGSSFSGTITFDDTAPLFVNYDQNQIHSGTFKLAGSRLSVFNGAFSTFWNLRIDDITLQNPLLFTSATLRVSTAVPEPAAVGLCGAFALGLVITFRRRKQS